jgi:type VI secretion system protein ImpH
MVTASGRQAGTVKELVLRHYARIDVFQLMRMLTCARSDLPLAQQLRFRADLSGAFPASEFSALTLRGAGAGGAGHDTGIADIRTANYCVASVSGPLPEPFTEWARDLERAREPAMPDFLNIFNQRLNVLRFELKSAQALGLNSAPPADTAAAYALAALMGMGTPDPRAQLPLPPRAWLGLAGLLANTRRSAAVVTQVLARFLHAAVTLEPMVGAWQAIAAQDRTELGRRSQCLGRSAVLGRRVWDQQARVRLVIATIDYARLCQLLPPGRGAGQGTHYDALVAMVHLLLDRQIDCEIELQVEDTGIPSAAPAPDRAPVRLRLGQSAWLRAHRSHPARPVRFLIPAHADAAVAR